MISTTLTALIWGGDLETQPGEKQNRQGGIATDQEQVRLLGILSQ
jgi:hypothetical protein